MLFSWDFFPVIKKLFSLIFSLFFHYFCRRVHISKAVLENLNDTFQVEPGNGGERDQFLADNQIETYLIVGKEQQQPQQQQQQQQQQNGPNTKVIISRTSSTEQQQNSPLIDVPVVQQQQQVVVLVNNNGTTTMTTTTATAKVSNLNDSLGDEDEEPGEWKPEIPFGNVSDIHFSIQSAVKICVQRAACGTIYLILDISRPLKVALFAPFRCTTECGDYMCTGCNIIYIIL